MSRNELTPFITWYYALLGQGSGYRGSFPKDGDRPLLKTRSEFAESAHVPWPPALTSRCRIFIAIQHHVSYAGAGWGVLGCWNDRYMHAPGFSRADTWSNAQPSSPYYL